MSEQERVRMGAACVGPPPVLLTIQGQKRVKHLALNLTGTLRGTRHPQALVEPHGCDDGVPGVRRLLPLWESGGRDDADPSAQRQEIAQNLEPRVGHVACPLTSYSSFPLFGEGGGFQKQASKSYSLPRHSINEVFSFSAKANDQC